jgi:hypothetical protein
VRLHLEDQLQRRRFEPDEEAQRNGRRRVPTAAA